MTLQQGQITRLVEVRVPGSPDGLPAVEVHTLNGPVLGFLYAPSNGTEGGLVFRPAPEEVQQLAGEPVEAAPDPAAAPAEPAAGAGTLTSGQVPSHGAGIAPSAPLPGAGEHDPNDPRGLRPGRDRRP